MILDVQNIVDTWFQGLLDEMEKMFTPNQENSSDSLDREKNL